MKTYSIEESIFIINYWIKENELPPRKDHFFSNWGLCEEGNLMSDLWGWTMDYISEN